MNPLILIKGELRRSFGGILALALVLALSLSLGVGVSMTERAVRQGTARAGDAFDLLVGAQGSSVQLYVSTFYQEGGSPKFDDGIKAWLNEDSTAMTNNGGNDTIAAVTAMGYDAYYVALEALKAAGSPKSSDVQQALWDVEYDGVSGHIAFDDENGDAVRDTAYIKHSTNDGAWELETQQTVQ